MPLVCTEGEFEGPTVCLRSGISGGESWFAGLRKSDLLTQEAILKEWFACFEGAELEAKVCM
jgi:hypothetical protein